MNHFTTKYWLLCGVAAIAWLLLGGKVASGQTPPPDNDNVVLSGVLTCNVGLDGQRVCPFKLHYVNLTKGRTYSIQMSSSDFDTTLVLEDLRGNLLARDTDYYDDLYGNIVFRPPVTGRYRLIANATAPKEGFYTITIRELPVVMSVTDELTPRDPTQNDISHKTFDVKLTAGRRYIIEMESDAFDAFVKLLNPDGAIIAFNDECGTQNNSRLVFEAVRTENYRIVATSFGPNATGAFTLTVCEE